MVMEIKVLSQEQFKWLNIKLMNDSAQMKII